MKTFRTSLAICAAVILVGAGCGSKPAETTQQPTPKKMAPLTLTSPSFAEGQPIPEKYTCKGQDFSPTVLFANVPPNAVSLALIMEDQDKPYTHWTLFNMSPGQGGIAEGDVAPGSVGMSSGDKMRYEGPCPPEGELHHYALTLYALNDALALQEGATSEEFKKAIEGKVIQESVLKGTFEAKKP